MNTAKILFLAVCLCTSALTHAQIRLSFNPTQGETYVYRFNSEQTTNQTVMGMEMPSTVTMDMLFAMTANNSNDNEVQVEFTYKEIATRMSSLMGNLEISSTLEGAAAQMFNAIIGKPIGVVFRRDGSVQSISGLDAVTEGLNPADPSAAILLSTFNEDAMRQMFEQSFNMYPSDAVNIGDSWNNDIQLSMMGMDSDIRSTYTLRSVNGNIATIDLVSVSTTTIEQNEISGESTGQITLDINTGMIITSTMTTTMSGNFVMEGMAIAMNSTATVSMTLER